MKLSIFIFCYERPNYLRRQLEVFKKLEILAHIYLLDGSKNKKKKDETYSLAEEFNIKYYHNVSYNKRLIYIKNFLETDYYAYCSDDDVIDPRYYDEAIKFLEKNKSYSSISGKIISLQYKKKYPYLGYRFVHHLDNNYMTNENDFIKKWKIVDEAYLSGSPPIYYAVKRKECYFKFIDYIKDLKYAIFIEQLDKMSVLFCGNVTTLKSFMGLRDYSAGSIVYDEREPQNESSFENDKKIMIKFLIDNLQNQSYSNSAAKIVLDSYNKKTNSNDKILKLRGNIVKIILDVFLNSFLNINFFGIDKEFTNAFRKSHKKLTKTFSKSF